MRKFSKLFTCVAAFSLVLTLGLSACTTPTDPKPDDGDKVTLTKIELDTENVKTEYAVGDTFDPTGLVVTAVYSDESTEVVTDYTYSPNGALTETDTRVTVSYQTKRAYIDIKVVDNTPPAAAPEANWIGKSVKNGKDIFNPADWLTPADNGDGYYARLTAPELEEDGSLKITGPARMGDDFLAPGLAADNSVLNPTHRDAKHNVLNDQDNVYSMQLKSTGHFGIMLFCTTKVKWGDENLVDPYRAIFVEYENGKFTFKMERYDNSVGATAEATVSDKEFTRVDFVVTRRDGATFEIKLYVDGYEAKLKGDMVTDGAVVQNVNGFGQNIEFVPLDEGTLWVNAPAAEVKPEPPVDEPDLTFPEDGVYTATDVNVKEIDGQAWYVVTGTYEKCTDAQLKAHLEELYFDFEYVNVWSRATSLDRVVTAADGKFEFRLNVTSLGNGNHTAHIGDKSKNFTSEDATLNGRSVTVGNKTYSLVNVPGSSKGEECYGTVGVHVADADAKNIKINGASFDLVAEGDKALVKITIETTDFASEDAIKAYLAYGNTDGAYEWKTECYKVEKVEEGVYNVYFDVTNMQAGGDGQLWSNLYLNGTKTEIKDSTHASNGKSITVGGKTYTVVCTGNNGTWNIPCIKVS